MRLVHAGLTSLRPIDYHQNNAMPVPLIRNSREPILILANQGFNVRAPSHRVLSESRYFSTHWPHKTTRLRRNDTYRSIHRFIKAIKFSRSRRIGVYALLRLNYVTSENSLKNINDHSL